MRHAATLFMSTTSSVAVGLLIASLSLGVQAQNLLSMVDAARAYDATYLGEVAGAEATRSAAMQGRAGVLPKLALQAQASRLTAHGNTVATSFVSTSQLIGLVATQSLYSATNIANLGKAKQGELGADVQLRGAEQSLLVRVAQAYFDVLTAQDEFASVQASKTATAQQLEAAKRNFEVGNTTITDTREAQAQFDSITAKEIASDNNLRVKELVLAQITGLSQPTPNRLANNDMPTLPQGDMAAWVTIALNNSVSIAAAKITLANAGLDIDIAQGGHKPTLDLSLSYNQKSASIKANPSTAIGLSFNMPLFTGYAVTNGVDAAVAKETQARYNLDNAMRNTTNSVKTAYLGLQSGIGQTKALQAALASSQSALEANQLGYEVGVRINIDVLNAQTNVFTTQAALAKARFAVLVGGLQVRQAAGTLTIDHVVALNQLLVP